MVARAFADLYRTQHQEFPPECRDADYETRIKAAYPIHPEIFDRLYTDWSTLVKFQRTRGVLRLMAGDPQFVEKGVRGAKGRATASGAVEWARTQDRVRQIELGYG